MTYRIRRMGLVVGAAIVALCVGAGLFAYSQNTSGGPGLFMGRRGGPGFPGFGGSILGPIQMMASQLGLNDAQKDQIKAIAQSHRDEWQLLADHVRTARQGLSSAITSSTFDEALIRDKSAALGQAEADVAVASARAFGEVLQILTPEQQAKLRALQAEGERRGQQSRQRGRAF
jgi:Spy/CpxP family protein refolding chaperone